MRKTRRVGRYHLTERIAFGGMAEVYRGFTFGPEGHRYDVAVKKLLPHYGEDGRFVTMLADEYRLVRRLAHANVARVYELVEVDGAILIAMEYVDGKDLRSTAQKAETQGRQLSFEDSAYMLARALDGLHHAHQARDQRGQSLGVVHRDFSPSNILVGFDGAVKVIDFGIAKASDSRIETKTGVIKGKVRYMSPEQAFGHKLDRRSDVFSAGTVLYELCTGYAAFEARSEADLIFAVREANPVPARERVPELPEELAAVIVRAMSRSRSARFQSALAFRDALVAFLRKRAPEYRRTRLARFMKRLWAEEIDEDLRRLEDYVLDLPEGGEDLGRNLLGDLPEDIAFSPRPTRVTTPGYPPSHPPEEG
ncbi:MAG: serine/threonine-protein kinase [Myxococcota bacterium]